MKLQAPRKLFCPECEKPFVPRGFGHREGCTIGKRYKLPTFVHGHPVLVFGSRVIPVQRYDEGIELLDQQLATNPDMSIIHGGARGGDNMADQWARANDVAREIWFPQWSLLGKFVAPFWRNAEMAARGPQEAIGLIGPCIRHNHRLQPPHPSHGSVDMALRLKALGIPVISHTWGFPGNLADFLGTKELQ